MVVVLGEGHVEVVDFYYLHAIFITLQVTVTRRWLLRCGGWWSFPLNRDPIQNCKTVALNVMHLQFNCLKEEKNILVH